MRMFSSTGVPFTELVEEAVEAKLQEKGLSKVTIEYVERDVHNIGRETYEDDGMVGVIVEDVLVVLYDGKDKHTKEVIEKYTKIVRSALEVDYL